MCRIDEIYSELYDYKDYIHGSYLYEDRKKHIENMNEENLNNHKDKIINELDDRMQQISPMYIGKVTVPGLVGKAIHDGKTKLGMYCNYTLGEGRRHAYNNDKKLSYKNNERITELLRHNIGNRIAIIGIDLFIIKERKEDK